MTAPAPGSREGEAGEPEVGDVRSCRYLECESCGAGVWDDFAAHDTDRAASEHFCYGCQRVICPVCVLLFWHFDKGPHGTGDPFALARARDARVERLEEALRGLLDAIHDNLTHVAQDELNHPLNAVDLARAALRDAP